MPPQTDRLTAGLVVEQLYQAVPGGSGRYIEELLRSLPAQGINPVGIAAQNDSPILGAPVRAAKIPRQLLYRTWNFPKWPRGEKITPQAQLIHATTWAIPPTTRPLVVTIHDVAFRRDASHFTRNGVRFFEASLKRAVKEADAIIVPSKASGQDCIKAGISAHRIVTIPHGCAIEKATPTAIADFKTRHHIEKPYILWCGTHEPRKNLAGIARAWDLLGGASSPWDLVLIGPAGWGETGADQILNRHAEAVHSLGKVSDAELAAAFAGAQVFVFPSLWEGFGLPVLEAMSQGTPVVTSAGTCMEEVVATAGVLVDPLDATDIARGIENAAANHQNLSAASLAQASQFSWETCARAHADLYRSLI